MERRNDSPRTAIARGKKRTSEAKQSKNRVGEKDKKANGRKGRKNIHKNPVVYEEEETFQRFRSEIIEACKTSRIFYLFIFSSGVCASFCFFFWDSFFRLRGIFFFPDICPSQGRTEETESLISCFPVQWRHGNWNFQNLSNCARPRVAVSHW
ncbi:hypothetical protein CDAR_112311 [Caerostris darwini]|uniref:Uncharacterized protein n=1 Tax=Caerostris darwini TaxID=1538125 RepID=A0AAV4P8E0_9ARAC|nr:hypothetical protein CDAR_112311 [Caerostris darwini]